CGTDKICVLGQCVDKFYFNRGGCTEPVVSCDNSNARNDHSCTCLDKQNLNLCGGMDGCGCAVPDRVLDGDPDAPTVPRSVSAGPLRSPDDWDLVVPPITGMELIEARPVQKTFGWKGEPIVNAPITQSIVVSLDSKID